MLLSKSHNAKQLTARNHDVVPVFREDGTVELPDAEKCGGVAFEMVALPGVTVTLNSIKHQDIQNFGNSVNVQGRFLIVAVENGFQIVGGSVVPVSCEEQQPEQQEPVTTDVEG